MTAAQAAFVWCPFPDRQSARDAAQQLLAEKLIACANILAPVESVFEWNGDVASEEEAVAVFKTTAARLDQVVARLGEIHPYDTPAIAGWRCDHTHAATLDWLGNILE